MCRTPLTSNSAFLRGSGNHESPIIPTQKAQAEILSCCGFRLTGGICYTRQQDVLLYMAANVRNQQL